MTGLADRPELPLMWIIVLVAGATILRQWIRQISRVTGGAFQLRVPWRQGEAGFHAMIKPRRRPAARVVTAAAVIAESTFMHVIAGVTTLATAAAKVGITFRAMAVTAGQVVMSVGQAETRDLEVIKGDANPVGRNMTIAAFGAVLPLVHVISLVTGDAGGANVGEVCRFVAILASGVGMRAG